jgi:hypothetical protein
MPIGDRRDRGARRKRLRHDPQLLLGRPLTPAFNRRDDLNRHVPLTLAAATEVDLRAA